MRSQLIIDGVLYCDWRVNIYDCKYGEFYRGVYWAEIGFWILNTFLGLFHLCYRYSWMKTHPFQRGQMGAIERMIILGMTHSIWLGIYSALMLSNGFGESYIFREIAYLVCWCPALTAIMGYMIGIINLLPKNFLQEAKDRIVPIPHIKVAYTLMMVIYWFWSVVPGAIMGVFHDRNNSVGEEIILKVQFYGLSVITFVNAMVFLTIGRQFILILKINEAQLANQGSPSLKPNQQSTYFSVERIKQTKQKIILVNYIIVAIILMFSISCLILPSYYGLFTLNIFAQIFGSLILLSANITISIVFLLFIALEIRSKALHEEEIALVKKNPSSSESFANSKSRGDTIIDLSDDL